MSATPTTPDTSAGTLGKYWEQTGFFRGLEGAENEKLHLEAPPGVPYGPLIFGSSPIAPTKHRKQNQSLQQASPLQSGLFCLCFMPRFGSRPVA